MLTTEVNIGIAFLAGLASFLAPCVLPMVPAYLSYLSGYTITGDAAAAAQPRHGHVIVHALFVVAGFSVIFILLGTAAGAHGRLVRGDWLRYVGGLVLVLFGLTLTGLLHIPLFDQEARLTVRRRLDWGVASSLVAGLAFGAGWTPCVGPALSSILVLSADQQTAAQGTLLLVAYSAGVGLPFIAAAALIERLVGLIRRIAPYQQVIHRATGVLIIVVGMVLFTDGFSAIGLWLQNRGIGWDLGI